MHKIYIVWSGRLSHDIAAILKEQLTRVFPAVNVFISSEIEKGHIWFNAIIKEIQGSKIGLICIVPGQHDSKWFYFESGILARETLHSDEDEKLHVHPIIFGSSQIDDLGPLENIQCTRFEKNDFYKLLTCIHKSLNDENDSFVMTEHFFHVWWNELATKVRKTTNAHYIRQHGMVRWLVKDIFRLIFNSGSYAIRFGYILLCVGLLIGFLFSEKLDRTYDLTTGKLLDMSLLEISFKNIQMKLDEQNGEITSREDLFRAFSDLGLSDEYIKSGNMSIIPVSNINLKYSYTVNNREYLGTNLGNYTQTTLGNVSNYLKFVGQPIEVIYLKDNPSVSFIDNDKLLRSNWMNGVTVLGILLIIYSIGAISLFGAWEQSSTTGGLCK